MSDSVGGSVSKLDASGNLTDIKPEIEPNIISKFSLDDFLG